MAYSSCLRYQFVSWVCASSIHLLYVGMACVLLPMEVFTHTLWLCYFKLYTRKWASLHIGSVGLSGFVWFPGQVLWLLQHDVALTKATKKQTNKQKTLFYRPMDLPSRVRQSGFFFFLVAKMTPLKITWISQKSDVLWRKIMEKYF